MLEALNYEGKNRSRCLPLAISVLADALADAGLSDDTIWVT